MSRTTAFHFVSALVAAAITLPVAAQPQAAGAPVKNSTQPATPKATVPAPSSQMADYIVAIVQREPVTNSEVRARVSMLERELTARKQPAPPIAELRDEALRQLILQSAMAQRAAELGIQVDDATVDRAMASMAQENSLTPDQFKARVQAQGVDYAALRRDVRRQILTARLRERTLDPTIKVTDADVDAWLAQNRAEAQRAAATGTAGPQLDIAQILVAVPETANAAEVARLQAKARDLLAKVNAPGADFTALVRQYSDATDAQSGGDFGMLPADRYPDLFVNAVASLQPGQVTGPVRSGAGFHLLKLVGRQQGSTAGATTVTETHARHILLRVSAQLPQQAAIAQLADDRKRIEAGQADFATLAREQSQDASAPQGGDLGWVPPGAFVPEFEQAMSALSPGQISQPVVSRFGVHLIQVIERRQVALDPQQQREAARNAVHDFKLEQAYDDWARDIRAQAYVEMRQAPQ